MWILYVIANWVFLYHTQYANVNDFITICLYSIYKCKVVQMWMPSVITFRMFIKYCPNVNDFCHQVVYTIYNVVQISKYGCLGEILENVW